jgi:hypothetical protein
LTSKLKTLDVSFELANDICELAGDWRNEPGGPKESPVSIPVCGDGARLWISEQSKEKESGYASGLWTLALLCVIGP